MKRFMLILFSLMLCGMISAQSVEYDYIPSGVQGFTGFHIKEISDSEIFKFLKLNTPIGKNIDSIEKFLSGVLHLSLAQDVETIIIAADIADEPIGIFKTSRDISYVKAMFSGNEIEVNGKIAYQDKTNQATVFYFASDSLLIVGKKQQIFSVIEDQSKNSGFIRKYGFSPNLQLSRNNNDAVTGAMIINRRITDLLTEDKDIPFKMLLSKVEGTVFSLNLKDSLVISLALICGSENLAASIDRLLDGLTGSISEIADTKIEPNSAILKWFSDRIKTSSAKKAVLVQLMCSLKEIPDMLKLFTDL